MHDVEGWIELEPAAHIREQHEIALRFHVSSGLRRPKATA
jgi:hypothetical protein